MTMLCARCCASIFDYSSVVEAIPGGDRYNDRESIAELGIVGLPKIADRAAGGDQIMINGDYVGVIAVTQVAGDALCAAHAAVVNYERHRRQATKEII